MTYCLWNTAVIDNRTVITGSFNWSPSASHQNDEVLLVIESPLLAAHFTREMDRLWRGAELGINERLARKLAANRRRCGSGVRRSDPPPDGHVAMRPKTVAPTPQHP